MESDGAGDIPRGILDALVGRLRGLFEVIQGYVIEIVMPVVYESASAANAHASSPLNRI
jgi:hypothetical protein